MKNIILVLILSLISGLIQAQDRNHSIKKIVIDPGHGGKDPGTHFGKILEKDIVLDVAIGFGSLIENNFPDVEVIYTRKSDKFVSLAYRAFKAAEEEADLFISIHVNSCPTPSVKGVETFVLGLHRSDDNFEVAKKENSVILLEENHSTVYQDFDPNSAESYIMFEMMQSEYLNQSLFLADKIQKQITKKASRSDRGVKQAGFLVLRETSMPGVLVELGFLGNKYDRQLMNSSKGIEIYSEALVGAFDDYIKGLDQLNEPSVNNDSDQLYAIQIMSSNHLVQSFDDLYNNEVYYNKTNNVFRYYVCASDNLRHVQEELKSVRKIYPDAFIVNDRTVDFTRMIEMK